MGGRPGEPGRSCRAKVCDQYTGGRQCDGYYLKSRCEFVGWWGYDGWQPYQYKRYAFWIGLYSLCKCAGECKRRGFYGGIVYQEVSCCCPYVPFLGYR